MAHETREPELDDDGLIVHRYDANVLCILPPEGYGDQILRYARSSLYNVHVGTWSVSSVTDELIKGRLQDEFMVDAPLSEAEMDPYAGVIVAGNDGRSLLVDDAKVLQLVRAADETGKLVAAWGGALEVLVQAGVVRGRKVTGDPRLAAAVAAAGGKYTGRQVEVAGHIVTAFDEGAGMRFGQALVEFVRI